MESLKRAFPIVIGVIVICVMVGFGYYLLVYQGSDYYTQIDNTKLERLSTTDDMKYEYTLTAYEKNGKEKEVKFKTSRELREDAYLKLEYMLLRGVKTWEEVQANELPEKVKIVFNVE